MPVYFALHIIKPLPLRNQEQENLFHYNFSITQSCSIREPCMLKEFFRYGLIFRSSIWGHENGIWYQWLNTIHYFPMSGQWNSASHCTKNSKYYASPWKTSNLKFRVLIPKRTDSRGSLILFQESYPIFCHTKWTKSY